ncbi:MAG: glycyl-radical enzyme activating protein [Chloroflexia bacterium]
MTIGLTFNVQRFSTEDGPGIRTTVFLKGCPLRCAWCHNPEGIHPEPELVWYETRCIGARDCLRVCPEGALTLTREGMQIDRERCTACGRCTEVCPAAALEVIGKAWEPAELLAELLRDQAFYDTSGGGVTFSGGEPALQAGFLREILPLCKQAGLNVALDTSGILPWETYEKLLPYVDLVLYDLKLWDPVRHEQATGVRNERILKNAQRLARSGVRLWIRTPVIPGYTADPENILQIARFIRNKLPGVERWDLLAYMNLGKPKYGRLARPYALQETPLLTREEIEQLWQAAAVIVPVARWSGPTRVPSR